jgi:hypothetical protein
MAAGSIGYLEMRGCYCGPGASAFAFLPSAYSDLGSTEHLPQQKQKAREFPGPLFCAGELMD